MKVNNSLAVSVFLLAMSVFSTAASGAIILDDGEDSGWQVTLSGATTGISGIDVDLNADEVRIHILKDFQPEHMDGGEFPATGSLTFQQTDPGRVSKIVITAETIQNNTGSLWSEFKWLLQPTGNASFDTVNTSWTVTPFTNLSLGSWEVAANSGIVPNGATFSPGGRLEIDVTPGATFFVLKQQAIPEPGTLVLLGCGTLAAVSRRRRGKPM